MTMGVLAVFFAGLLGVKPTAAAPRWELGPKQEFGWSDGTVPLADGRLLTCPASTGTEAARAIAIGSGILTGGALGALGTFALSKAAYASRNPGDDRFATAAVPLSAAWLTGLGLPIDAW